MLACILSIAACADEAIAPSALAAGRVHVYLQSGTVAPGAEVTFTVDNVGPTQVGFGACPDAVETETRGVWHITGAIQPPDACDAVLFIVGAGERARGAIHLSIPSTAPAGTYRIRTDSMRDLEGNELRLPTVYSDAFQVVRP